MHSCVLENTVLFACAAGGLPQTAPEGLVPLDSLSSPAGGTKEGPKQILVHTNIKIRN